MKYLLVVWVRSYIHTTAVNSSFVELLLSRRTYLLSPTSGRVININFPGESACEEHSGHHHRSSARSDQEKSRIRFPSFGSSAPLVASASPVSCSAPTTRPLLSTDERICSTEDLLLQTNTASQFNILLIFFSWCC
ncbi:hypothetical protein TWF970_008424 [Orbilia oligospora]|uniref:Uncharacterized protein n=1 Tax=Orbilia oligospora TaxID=2813651 RepID=A0A7C8V9U2_ORBOL|nr:hypothetical protein TWF970_008424 [Orbilia oligospora]